MQRKWWKGWLCFQAEVDKSREELSLARATLQTSRGLKPPLNADTPAFNPVYATEVLEKQVRVFSDEPGLIPSLGRGARPEA